MDRPKEYDLLVFIGRFQPFHTAHKKIIETALQKARRVLVCIGSANQQRSVRNPFTYDERVSMISECFLDETNLIEPRLFFTPLNDCYDDVEWTLQVQDRVSRLMGYKNSNIGTIGFSKDHTSYYLKLFPQWESVNVISFDPTINSTDIRNHLFELPDFSETDRLNFAQMWADKVPDSVLTRLFQFRYEEPGLDNNGVPIDSEFRKIVAEHEYCEKYKQKWAGSPYPPVFQTVDAVVVQSGNVLLIERKAMPGKGKLALPGGFINQNEKLFSACLRELYEETRIDVPEHLLRASMIRQMTFDSPHRDPRGRFITTAFLFSLPLSAQLPAIKGGSDAKKAMWCDIATISPKRMFIDHAQIIDQIIKVI